MSQDQSGQSDEIMKRLEVVTDEALGRPKANTLAGAMALDPHLAAALAERAEISEELPIVSEHPGYLLEGVVVGGGVVPDSFRHISVGYDPAEPAEHQQEPPPNDDSLTRELDRISLASGVGLEDLAQAFLALREELETDAEVFTLLEQLALQTTALGCSCTALAERMLEAAKGPAAQALRAERQHHPGRIVVPGGMRGIVLPPSRELDGTPDPALAAMMREGASRYHLETLAQLDAESRRPAPEPRRPVGAVLALSAAAIVAALSTPELEEAPHHSPTRPVRAEGGARSPRAAEANVAPKPGCRNAGCRTFADCLCTCASCEVDCFKRKKPRQA